MEKGHSCKVGNASFFGVKFIKIYDFIFFFIFSTLICTPCDKNSQGQPYKIIKHFFGASLVILVSHHHAVCFYSFQLLKATKVMVLDKN